MLILLLGFLLLDSASPPQTWADIAADVLEDVQDFASTALWTTQSATVTDVDDYAAINILEDPISGFFNEFVFSTEINFQGETRDIFGRVTFDDSIPDGEGILEDISNPIDSPISTPEPPSLALLALGLCAVVGGSWVFSAVHRGYR